MLFMGFITFQFNGCSSASSSLIVDDEYSQVMRIFDKLTEKKEIVGIGVASPNDGDDVSFQESLAIAIAQTRISNRVETKVISKLKEYTQETGIKDNKKFIKDVKEAIITKTKNTLKGAKIKKRLRGKSGKIYILMTLKTQDLLNALKLSSDDIKDKETQIQYIQFTAGKYWDELEQDLGEKRK